MTLPARHLTAPTGFRAAAGTCGIKPSGLADLMLVASDTPARCAAVFTRNAFVGAPVIIGRRHTARGRCRAIVCNSGIANVATGRRGLDDALAMCQAVADTLHCKPTEVLPCSTGVIGRRLPIDKITPAIVRLAGRLRRNAHADADAATAILTTDTRPKAAVRRLTLAGAKVTLGAVAKGSGMIAPNLATMLAFITTDADLPVPRLRAALRRAVNADASFNRLSVDSDTSTSDTVALLANGAAGHRPIAARSTDEQRFTDALTDLCGDLAYQIISDGEGVEHVMHITVTGARSHAQALAVARSVADSPLVKTAVHGADPNWGRLVMAVGKNTAANVRPDRLVIRIGPTVIFQHGEPARFRPATISRLMKKFDVPVTIDLGLGRAACRFLGCDLSRRYIAINADYHT